MNCQRKTSFLFGHLRWKVTEDFTYACVFNDTESCHQGKPAASSDGDAAVIGDKITMLSVERHSLQLHIPPLFVWLISRIDGNNSHIHTHPLIHSAMIHPVLRVKPLFSMCYILSDIGSQLRHIPSLIFLHCFKSSSSSFLLPFFQTSPVLHYHSHSCSLLIVLFLKLSGSIIA